MDFSKYKVLIIDDEEIYTKYLRRIVSKEIGAQAIIALGAEEAFDHFKKEIPDLVILDMQMPKMDGITVLKLIRKAEKTRNIPVIACTALARPEIVASLVKLKISDYILKTSDPGTYKSKIIKVLEGIAAQESGDAKTKKESD